MSQMCESPSQRVRLGTSRFRVGSIGAWMVAAAVVYGCSSCASTRPERAGRSACSEGPEYLSAAFPIEDPASDESSLPVCIPRCGTSIDGGQGFYLLSALPSGSCDIEGERCRMPVSTICCNGLLGKVDGMRCACVARSWQCVMTSPGLGGCRSCSDAAGAADGGGADSGAAR